MTTVQPPDTSVAAPVAEEPDQRAMRRGSAMLLLGAILLPIGSQLHPTGDADLGWDGAVAQMLDDGAWYPAHIVEFASVALILAALWQISTTPLVRGMRALRVAVLVAAAGSLVHLIDLVPHTFAATEADAFLSGGGTPLFDTHLVLQAFAGPVLCIGIAAMAVLDARRSPRWTWIPAGLAVVGGALGAIAGPALLLTEDLDYTALMVGYAGIVIWLLVVAIRRTRAVWRHDDVVLT